ncbi:hypothetical protein Tco_0756266 [Tanacetum coccineum]
MEMRSDATILVADTKKAIKASKHDFRSKHQTGGSSEGAGSKPEVLDEPKGNSKDTSEGAGSKLEVPDVSTDQESEYESWGESDEDDDDHKNDEEEAQEDKFIHTLYDYVPTINETQDVNDEEYNRINEELYGDVNVEMKDVEAVDEGKEDEELTDAEKIESEHKEINQEVASTQIQDEIQATTTASPTTQKEKIEAPPSSSSSVSSHYVLVIPKPIVLSSILKITTEAPATTISPLIPPFIPHTHQSTPIPTPTTIKATTSTLAVPDSETLFAIHLRVSNMEKEVKELKNIDHSTKLLAIIKSEVLMVVKQYLGTNLGTLCSSRCHRSA